MKTIQQNHMHAMNEVVGNGTNPVCANMATRSNPAHDDMMDVASFVNPDFLVNVVPNLDGEICGIFAGNWVSAWLEATKLVDRIFGVPIEEQADIVIASAGGYPKDINLYQTQKTLDNAAYAMKPNGACIILAECPDIKEPAEFFEWFDEEDPVEMEKVVRANFLLSGWVAVRQTEYAKMGKIILLTRTENSELAQKVGVTPVDNIQAALKLAYEHCGIQSPRSPSCPREPTPFPS